MRWFLSVIRTKLKEKNARHLGTGGPESVNAMALGSRPSVAAEPGSI